MKDSTRRELLITARFESEHVVIDVTDTGCGMTPDIQGRIFEPFYTSKPSRDAIGLGLATCRKELDACGGTIDCASVPGRGSTFTISLPVQAAETANI
jgi:hypothetical protein